MGEILMKHLTAQPNLSKVGEPYRSVIARALEKDPAKRFSNVSEMLALLPLAWMLLRWRRQGRPDRFVLGSYLVVAGAVRFFIEFLRMRESLAGPFAIAHLLSFVAFATGVVLLAMSRAQGKPLYQPSTR